MERFVKGTVVVIPFPFSDLSDVKKRPALVISALRGDDYILCQITSKARFDDYSIALENDDFETGGLNQTSTLRPNRLFTADRALIKYKVGCLRPSKVSEIVESICEIVRS